VVDSPETVRAYVALGSNLGERKANMKRAVEMLGRRDGIEIVQVSPFIETKPVGGPPGQFRYLNSVAALDTTLQPRELLAACMEVESQLGRAREVRWGPRTIDMDILLYGDEVVSEPDLEIPHPRMHERIFVLMPLTEIAPSVRHPRLGKTARELLDMLTCGSYPGHDACLRDAKNPKGN